VAESLAPSLGGEERGGDDWGLETFVRPKMGRRSSHGISLHTLRERGAVHS